MRAQLRIKAVRRADRGDSIVLIEEPIERMPPKVELRGGERDGQEGTCRAMRFDPEAGTLTLCNNDSGEEILSLEGELTLTDSWTQDKDSGDWEGSCAWKFDTERVDPDAIGALFESPSFRADFKPSQRKMEFVPGEKRQSA